MQHKHHSYKYVLYVSVSCASSRWNWPNRNVVGTSGRIYSDWNIGLWLDHRVNASGKKLSWSSLSFLIFYEQACLRLWNNVDWNFFFFFHLLFVFLACSAKYDVFCLLLLFVSACFIAVGPMKGRVVFACQPPPLKSTCRETLGLSKAIKYNLIRMKSERRNQRANRGGR